MVCPPKIKIILLVPNNARENSPQDCMLTLNKGCTYRNFEVVLEGEQLFYHI